MLGMYYDMDSVANMCDYGECAARTFLFVASPAARWRSPVLAVGTRTVHRYVDGVTFCSHLSAALESTW